MIVPTFTPEGAEWKGAKVRLTPRQTQFVEALVSNQGKRMTYVEIRDAVWGPGYALGAHGDDPQLAVRQLACKASKRFRLVDPGFDRIEASWRVGYRWRTDDARGEAA